MRRIAAALGRFPRAAWPLVLLVVVALGQTAAVKLSTMSPWKGGGFAMFASIDSGSERSLILTISEVDGTDHQPVLPGPPWRPHVLAARAWPTPERLAELNRWMLAQPWQVLAAPAGRADPPAAWLLEETRRLQLAPVRTLTVRCAQAEVLAPVYDPQTGKIHARPIASQRRCTGP
jgi:hypothetical protein